MTKPDSKLVAIVNAQCAYVCMWRSQLKRHDWTALIDTWWGWRKSVWLGYMNATDHTYYLASNKCVYRTTGKRRIFWRLPPRLCYYSSLVRFKRLTAVELEWVHEQLSSLEKEIKGSLASAGFARTF